MASDPDYLPFQDIEGIVPLDMDRTQRYSTGSQIVAREEVKLSQDPDDLPS